MCNLREKALIAEKWIRSFLKSDWRLDDYPVRVRRNGDNPEPKWAWLAQILNWAGPTGLGPTKEQAVAHLNETLENIRKNRRRMPRPGTEVPIEFASSTRVDSNPQLRDQFIKEVLGFDPDGMIFISDVTSLDHFGDQERVADLRNKVLETFGVSISDLKEPLVCDILERIAKAR